MDPLSQSGDIHLELKVEREPRNLDRGTCGLRSEELAEDFVDCLKVAINIGEVDLDTLHQSLNSIHALMLPLLTVILRTLSRLEPAVSSMS
jgi:hypothetical protein